MMKKLFKKVFLWAFLLVGYAAFAQSISGNVSDQDGPLPGANVIVKGTANGTTTDFDGNFTLSNVPSDGVLVVSYLGYVSQEVNVNGQSSISITLVQDASELDEIVVVAYGAQSRTEVTGAISTIDSEEITALPVATADQALQGRAAGVTVINSGSPGVAPVVRVRGIGSTNGNGPLYVIDGVITGGMGNLNPNDIESINVLKDASTAAAYGSQASEGVVIITTKRGKSGKPQVTFNSYTGIAFTNSRYDVLNTAQYVQYAQDAFGIDVTTSPNYNANINTNWQDEVFQSGFMENYDVSLAGGSENSNFRVSLGYLDQEGTIIETGFERFNVRANSDFQVNDKIKIGETLSVSFSNQNPENAGGGRSLIEHAIKAAPYLNVFNSNNLGGFQGPTSALDGQDAENPVRVQTLGYRENKVAQIIGNVYGELEIIDGLKFRSQVGLEYSDLQTNNFTPSYDDDSQGQATHAVGFAAITKNRATFRRFMLTNSLNYVKTFGEVHNFDVLLLAETNDSEFNQLNSSSQNPISDQIDQVSNEQASLTSTTDEIFKIGYLARLNYNYDQKYLFSASIRRDGSSVFGPNNKWGNFPSFSVGWNIAKEDFMADSNFNSLKLRGSWGTVGFDRIRNYAFSSTLSSNFFYPINGQAAVGTTGNGIGNASVAWEEKEMINVGVDFAINNSQFTGAIEYYQNNSNNLLLNKPLAPSLGDGQGNIVQNVGDTTTKGFEFTLGYNSNSSGDFNWSANLNLTTVDNTVNSLNVPPITGGNFENNNISYTDAGESIYSFYGLQTDGIYQTQAEVDAALGAGQTNYEPGDIRFVDQDGSQSIGSEDYVVIGNPFPDFTFGLNFDANYKNWDMNLFINGSVGNDIYNTNVWDLEGMDRLFNSSTRVLNRWTGPGTSNSIPRAGNLLNLSPSDRFIEDGSFTRLKNITVGYTFNEGTVTKYISKLRVYVSGQNLITLTDYSGLDPEVGASGVIANAQYELGIDRGTYPQPKSLLAGIQVTF